MEKQKKPSGIRTSILISSSGVHREKAHFPGEKAELELLFAKAFCGGKPPLNPHITQYGSFTKLKAQPENNLDFRVITEKGQKWLELAEFAPLNNFGGRYENIPTTWTIEDMINQFLALIMKKNSKSYGNGVILLIYNTHDSLFVPPPIIRSVRKTLASSPPTFEAIYFISAYSEETATVWQVWPNNVKDEGPMLSSGTVHIGF